MEVVAAKKCQASCRLGINGNGRTLKSKLKPPLNRRSICETAIGTTAQFKMQNLGRSSRPNGSKQDDGGDNEIDGDDAIKLYNQLVKSPEDRRALEKELPSLVAARDKAVTAAKREQLQKETAEIPGHAAKMRR